MRTETVSRQAENAQQQRWFDCRHKLLQADWCWPHLCRSPIHAAAGTKRSMPHVNAYRGGFALADLIHLGAARGTTIELAPAHQPRTGAVQRLRRIGRAGRKSNVAGRPKLSGRLGGLPAARVVVPRAEQFDASRSFEVVGSHTGKRYKICLARGTNVQELDPPVGRSWVGVSSRPAS